MKHKADVEHVRREHPELADWLTTFAAEFGRGEIDYRVTLRNERR